MYLFSPSNLMAYDLAVFATLGSLKSLESNLATLSPPRCNSFWYSLISLSFLLIKRYHKEVASALLFSFSVVPCFIWFILIEFLYDILATHSMMSFNLAVFFIQIGIQSLLIWFQDAMFSRSNRAYISSMTTSWFAVKRAIAHIYEFHAPNKSIETLDSEFSTYSSWVASSP